jgi:hypothetical protein
MKQLHLLYKHPSRPQWESWQMEDVAVTAGIQFGEQRYLTKLESATLNVLPTGLLCTVLSLVSILPAIGRSQFPGLLAWKLLFTALALAVYLIFGHVIVKRRERTLSICGEAVKKFNEYKSMPGSSAP